MSFVSDLARCARFWWLLLLGLCLLPLAASFSCWHDPEKALARVPVGSRLSELDKHIGRFYSHSEVEQWSIAPIDGGAKAARDTKYGSFYVRELGTYAAFKASNPRTDSFTGEMRFYHMSWVIPDDIEPSFVLALVYVNGVLKEKDYGILPG